MHAPSITTCSLVTLGPALITLGLALALGVDPRAAAFGSLGAAVIALTTGLAQRRMIEYGLAWAFGAQLGAVILRLALALVALGLARSAGVDAVVAVCMALPLAAAVVGDAALLARASARLDLTAKEPARA